MKAKDLVESTLLYVGIPAITLYPLGFAALGIQLYRDGLFPYQDFTNIWSAVSLIRETEVIGTGVELVYLSLVATMLGMATASAISGFLRRRLSEDSETSLKKSADGRLWSLYWILLLPVTVFLAWDSVFVDDWIDIPLAAGFVAFSTGGGVLIWYARGRVRDGRFFALLASGYAGAVLAALCIAALQPPDLPLIEMDATAGAATSCSETPGNTFVFLTLDTPYWYVYNSDGLFALPSTDAKLVRWLAPEDCDFSRSRV